MGRFEAFALGNGPWESFLDGIGNAAGYGIILIIVGTLRELFGSGTLLGFEVFGSAVEGTGLYALGYENNGFMVLPPIDRKSTRLNSSHVAISYAVFCLKKKNS